MNRLRSTDGRRWALMARPMCGHPPEFILAGAVQDA